MKNRKGIIPIVAMVIMCIVLTIVVRKSGEPLSVETGIVKKSVVVKTH